MANLYTHNSRKAKSAYHIATSRGTLCKMERSPFIRWQDSVTEAPPPGKRLCHMCSNVRKGRELDAEAWGRLEAF